jgi:hypothetical protein
MVSIPPALLKFAVLTLGLVFGLPGVIVAAPLTVILYTRRRAVILLGFGNRRLARCGLQGGDSDSAPEPEHTASAVSAQTPPPKTKQIIDLPMLQR